MQKVKLSLEQAVKAHNMRCRGSHIFWIISSQMAVRLSALRTWLPFNPQEDSWYSFLLEA
jgi:hypothetical protein